jgi:SAM-dependent methyltransferase
MAGDIDEIATTYAGTAAEFDERLGLRPGERVLDLACGTGNQSIPAARAGAEVTGIDLAPNLVWRARANAARDSVSVAFDEGDVEDLPYTSGAFDTVMSMFGCMFAPNPDRVAAEALRVCRPGGRIVLANWTPDSFVGRMFQITGRYVAPPPMKSPLLWGQDAVVRERFGAGARALRFTPRTAWFDLSISPADTVRFFKEYYGPTQQAFSALDGAARDGLRRDLEDLWTAHNLGDRSRTIVSSAYVEVVIERA